MKAILALGILSLASTSFLPTADANTFAGQACQTRSAGVQLAYDDTGARNTSAAPMLITCPAVRLKDGGTAPAGAVFYFVNDGLTKNCFFDNFNIDTGGLGIWTSASGVSRLVLPTLSTTLAWQPFAFNCSLPVNSKVTGYFIAE